MVINSLSWLHLTVTVGILGLASLAVAGRLRRPSTLPPFVIFTLAVVVCAITLPALSVFIYFLDGLGVLGNPAPKTGKDAAERLLGSFHGAIFLSMGPALALWYLILRGALTSGARPPVVPPGSAPNPPQPTP